MIAGTSLGILDIIFALALCAFALWKTAWIRVILSIGIVVWGAFAMEYDIKIAAPLITLGAMLLIMGIMNVIGRYRESA